MSDIKNLFADTFGGYDLSMFAESDLRRLGFKTKEVEPSTEQQKVERCPRHRRRPRSEPKSENEKIFNRNKIIPLPPSIEPIKRYKYKHIKSKSIKDAYEANKARHKLYYHSHREELKFKRLVKQGRTELIDLLLTTVFTE
jgi:hypothetical protein